METTDFTYQDGRSQLQLLRKKLALAVTDSRGNADKVIWLAQVLSGATIIANAGLGASDFLQLREQDIKSDNTKPDLLHVLDKALSEASIYGGDYKTQLLSDLADADTILTA